MEEEEEKVVVVLNVIRLVIVRPIVCGPCPMALPNWWRASHSHFLFSFRQSETSRL